MDQQIYQAICRCFYHYKCCLAMYVNIKLVCGFTLFVGANLLTIRFYPWCLYGKDFI